MSELENIKLFERAGALMMVIAGGEASELNRLVRENDLETMNFYVKQLEKKYFSKKIEVDYTPSEQPVYVWRGSHDHYGHTIDVTPQEYEPQEAAFCMDCEEYFLIPARKHNEVF